MYARRKAARDRQNQAAGEPLPHVGRIALRSGQQDILDEDISLVDIWRILSRRRAIVLGMTLLVGLVFSAAAMLMTPVYRAEVLLTPVTDMDDNQRFAAPLTEFGSLAALAGITPNHKDKKHEAIATLKSRRFTEQFIEDRKLLPVLFASLWDSERDQWKASVDKENIPTLWDGYEKFSISVRRVREDRVTGMVALSVEWSNPDIAAQWANALVSSVNDSLRMKAVEVSDKSIGYLQDQLTRTTVVDLQQVLHSLIESEMKKIILARINEEFAFRVIDPAVVPEDPVRPKLLPMAGLGIMLGLLAGVVVALLLNAAGSVREPQPGKKASVTRALDASRR